MCDLDLSKYYFLKLFEKKIYLEEFIGGEFYFSALSKHSKQGNTAQIDKLESFIFYDEIPNKKVMIFNKAEDIIDGASPICCFDPTSLQDDCYALCFFMLPKEIIHIEKEGLYFKNGEKGAMDFIKMVKSYGTNKKYFAIIDAKDFVLFLDDKLNRKNICFEKGSVLYSDNINEDKVYAYFHNNQKQAALYKESSYSYQNEYRYLIPKRNNEDDSIWVNTQSVKHLVVKAGEILKLYEIQI